MVTWSLLLAVFVGKTCVFFLVFVLSLVIGRGDLGRASLYSIFTTQANDFVMGYPISWCNFFVEIHFKSFVKYKQIYEFICSFNYKYINCNIMFQVKNYYRRLLLIIVIHLLKLHILGVLKN